MKIRQIGLALAVIAVAGVWFGRMAWRAHRNLVTLHARNAPLAEVVHSMQWQTWEKIRFDKTMNARITLNLDDVPLDAALDLVADRAGARWQKTYAVGASTGAMKGLESVLDGAVKLEAVGWTNVAPQFPEGEPPDAQDANPPPEDGKPRQLDHKFSRPGGDELGGGPRPGPGRGGVTMMTIGPDGAVDRWSSERLVLEARLVPLLSADFPAAATAEAAARAASSVHGRSRLYYALAKAPFGEGPPPSPFGGRPGKGGGGPFALGDPGEGMASQRRQQRLRELSRSPEEQVERARQRHPGRIQSINDGGANQLQRQ